MWRPIVGRRAIGEVRGKLWVTTMPQQKNVSCVNADSHVNLFLHNARCNLFTPQKDGTLW